MSLNSQEQFSDGSIKGTFPYARFYNGLVEYLEERMPVVPRAELLAYWNAYVAIVLTTLTTSLAKLCYVSLARFWATSLMPPVT